MLKTHRTKSKGTGVSHGLLPVARDEFPGYNLLYVSITPTNTEYLPGHTVEATVSVTEFHR